MKILFITPSPPNNLNRIRSKNIIRSLHDLGHQVTVISLYKNQKEYSWLQAANKYSYRTIGIYQPIWKSLFNCLICLFLPVPLRVSYCYSAELGAKLKEYSKEDFDLVYIKRLRMAQYAKYFNKEKVFIDITDSMIKYYERLKAVASGFAKILAYEEYFKMKIYEKKICDKYKNIIICSNDDRDYLVDKYHCGKSHFMVLENGLYIKDWNDVQARKRINSFNLIFWGVMNVDTNKLSCNWFLKNVWPLLDNKKFRMKIIGPKPTNKLLKNCPTGVEFTGYVDRLSDQLFSGGIFVCPIISGAGVKNKIIQAAVLGLPTISTSLGVEGINSELKDNIFIANNPKDFSEMIKLVANMDEKSLNAIIKKQRKIVMKHYNVFKLTNKLFDNA